MASEFEKTFKRLEEAFNEAIKSIQSRKNTKIAARRAKDLIVTRTRLGFGAVEDQPKQKLAKLSESYKLYRKGLKKGEVRFIPKRGPKADEIVSFEAKGLPRLSSKTTTGKSNLTLTAQMLDSLKESVIGPGRFKIKPTGTREDGKHTNEQVAGFVADNGRPFLALSEQDEKQLSQFLEKVLTQRIEKALSKLK